MKTKFKLLFCILALILATGTINHVVAKGAAGCDPAYVTQNNHVISVQPTGVDDTANIQCAFDTAVAVGDGTDVHLTQGTFYTAQIVVEGFKGEFTGNSAHSTKIVNLPDLYVTPSDMYFEPPSAENPWPALFAFIDGDFRIADLTIRIVGEEPTTGWSIFGIDPPLMEMAGAIYILGVEADALIENVIVEGEVVTDPESWFGYNLINGIFYEGFIGESPLPISGSFEVYHSLFRQLVSGTPVVNVSDAEIVIDHNRFVDVGYAADGGDFVDSSVTFSQNKVNAATGLEFYNIFNVEDVNTTILITNNKFRGETGPVLHSTFGAGITCQVLNNKAQHVTGTGINLGTGTRDCFVAANNTTIVDLGIDNVIVGHGNTILYE